MRAIFWLSIMFWMQISHSRFKQSRISLLIPHIYVLGLFVNFLVIFWYVWTEINSFSQRLSKIYGNRKFWRFGVVLKLVCLKLKICRYTPNSCTTTWSVIVGSGNCLVVFHNPFPLFKLSLNFLKFHIKFRCTPALKYNLDDDKTNTEIWHCNKLQNKCKFLRILRKQRLKRGELERKKS